MVSANSSSDGSGIAALLSSFVRGAKNANWIPRAVSVSSALPMGHTVVNPMFTFLVSRHP